MQLRDLQNQFSTELLNKQPTPIQDVIEQRGFQAAQRLNIYRNNINATLIESLQNIYPVSCTLVGEDFFRSMAHSYVGANTPETGDLREYGEHLAAYMQSMPALEKLPYMPDIARIDWACHVSFHAQSLPVLTVNKLGEFSPDSYEQLKFKLHPAIIPINSKFPIFDIWEFAVLNDPASVVPNLDANGQSILVYRKDNAVKVAHIDLELFTMIDLILKEQTLGTIIASILDLKPDYNLQSGLHRLFSFDAICSISINH